MKNLKSLTLAIFGTAIAFGLSACGGDGTTEQIVNNYSSTTVDTKNDLPDCTDEIAGQTAFVRKTGEFYGCDGDKWLQLGSNTISVGDNVCSSTELKDESGFEIFCNGKSIGVVRNGADGQDGEKGEKGDKGATGATGANGNNGTGCEIETSSELTVTIACGSETFTMDLSAQTAPELTEECEAGSEECTPLDNVKLEGVSQKGPFVKGANVVAYELLSGKSLKQTGNNYSGTIESDNGLFNIKTVKLASQYAYLVAEGYYRNEITGNTSISPIKLRALTNLNGRSKANINLVTHLEYDRVVNLVTKDKMKVLDAKKKAEKEIFEAFGIDASKFDAKSKRSYAEDFTVLEEGSGNAALLAISVLLQGERNEAQLTALLASFSLDLGDDGIWGNLNDRAQIADWAMEQDLSGQLDSIRKNIADWKLTTTTVPAFEAHVRNFWQQELNLPSCADSIAGVIKRIGNSYSKYYAAKDTAYNETTDKSMVRLVCDAESKGWRFATDLEKDTYGYETSSQPKAYDGKFNSNIVYVYENDAWRLGTELDLDKNLGPCSASKLDKIAMSFASQAWFKCTTSPDKGVPFSWISATNAEADTVGFVGKFVGQIEKGNTSDTYYYCTNTSTNSWRIATTMEKDTYDHSTTKKPWAASVDGKVLKGTVTDTLYVFDEKEGWRPELSQLGSAIIESLGGCTNKRSSWTYGEEVGEEPPSCTVCGPECAEWGWIPGKTYCDYGYPKGLVKKASDNNEYLCIDNQWRMASADRVATYKEKQDITQNHRLVLGDFEKQYIWVNGADSFRLENDAEKWYRVSLFGDDPSQYWDEAMIIHECDENTYRQENFFYTNWICDHGKYVWNGNANNTVSSALRDLENNKYDVLTIGNQIWITSNLQQISAWEGDNYCFSYMNSARLSDELKILKTQAEKAKAEKIRLMEMATDASVYESAEYKFADSLSNAYYKKLNEDVPLFNESRCKETGTFFKKSRMEYACNHLTSANYATEGKTFHLPSKNDWLQMLKITGADKNSKILKSESQWNQGNGTNDLFFNVLPVGSIEVGESYVHPKILSDFGTEAIYLTSDNYLVIFDKSNNVTIQENESNVDELPATYYPVRCVAYQEFEMPQ